jgi:hypothetical protein
MITMTLSAMISQPVWILVTLIGVADILIFAWCITLIRRNRNRQQVEDTPDEFAFLPEQPVSSGQFQQNLTCMQIDAVFDGLAALIETERIKLKALIHPATAPARDEPASPQNVREDIHDFTSDASRSPQQELPLDEQIARIADSGMKPAAIAGRLGISLAEVDLALRMRNSAKSATGYKLEAVA